MVRLSRAFALILLVAFLVCYNLPFVFIGGVSKRQAISSQVLRHMSKRQAISSQVPRQVLGGEAADIAVVDAEALKYQLGSAESKGVIFRQNFQDTPEDLLNQQVQMELTASHFYLSMAAYFDRADVALPGFQNWAKKQSEEQREDAEKFIKYINLRGGKYVASNIAAPTIYAFDSALDAMSQALKLEVFVNGKLLQLHSAASDAVDPQLCDFLEEKYLEEQVEIINRIAKVVRKLIRTGPELGEYMVDQEMDDA